MTTVVNDVAVSTASMTTAQGDFRSGRKKQAPSHKPPCVVRFEPTANLSPKKRNDVSVPECQEEYTAESYPRTLGVP